MSKDRSKRALLMNAVIEERVPLYDYLDRKFEVVVANYPRTAITALGAGKFEIAVLKVVCGGETDAAKKVLSAMTTIGLSFPVIVMTPEEFIEPAETLQQEFPKLVTLIFVSESDPCTILDKVKLAQNTWLRQRNPKSKKRQK